MIPTTNQQVHPSSALSCTPLYAECTFLLQDRSDGADRNISTTQRKLSQEPKLGHTQPRFTTVSSLKLA